MPVYLVTTARMVEQVGYVEVYADSEAAATSAVILDKNCVRDHIVWVDTDHFDEFRVNRAHDIRGSNISPIDGGPIPTHNAA